VIVVDKSVGMVTVEEENVNPPPLSVMKCPYVSSSVNPATIVQAESFRLNCDDDPPPD
jgi:hypothetical protein